MIKYVSNSSLLSLKFRNISPEIKKNWFEMPRILRTIWVQLGSNVRTLRLSTLIKQANCHVNGYVGSFFKLGLQKKENESKMTHL